MRLDRLILHNFKNISRAELEFSGKINCFLGNNGMGKSNLLDSIYYLSFCKSFSGSTDTMLIKRGEDFAMANADYTRRDVAENLTLGLARGRRKSLKRGGKEYDRLSRHIGTFPLVMAAPQDMELIQGAGEERRRWMDMVISQSDAKYLDALIRYGYCLEQRNKLLRDGMTDHTLYLAIETGMDMSARYIDMRRREWTDNLTGIFSRLYYAIAGEKDEEVKLELNSSLSASSDGSLMSLLDETRRHDEAVRHTSVGPHRDDIAMSINGMPMKRTGSQGQCKTFTLALRMAQYEFLHHASKMKPILLLDDIFDKLDSERVERIMSLVTSEGFGQIFVTDTNRKHLDSIIEHTGGDFRMWTVSHGEFTPNGN